MSVLMDTMFNTEGVTASVSDGAVDISSVPSCDGIGSDECRELATWLNEAADQIDANEAGSIMGARLLGNPPHHISSDIESVSWTYGCVDVTIRETESAFSAAMYIRIGPQAVMFMFHKTTIRELMARVASVVTEIESGMTAVRRPSDD